MRNITSALVILGVMTCFTYCSRNPYAATNKVYRQEAKTFAKELKAQPAAIPGTPQSDWVGTTNFNLRKPAFVIIHHTAQNSCDQTLKTFTMQKTQVSAHYVICRNGTVHHMLNDYLRAWHGGVARWGNLTDINSSSIGIELDNNGNEPFDSLQINSLITLLTQLKSKYAIPVANFIGHGDIAPGRKVDPSAYFPWQQLADKGFGLWYKDTSLITVPPTFDAVTALRIVGYDVKDSVAAIKAFKRHFIPADTTAIFDDGGRKILYSIESQSR
ncbi:N-acetylmuramoyl-L-alanine amidase [Chitinophaga terrae (ex Kim and Jung 2007)]|uniref:N-acetylmuramoyl-L-alanine amidase n=1 Tax=Chitinophaga terrae (ex Kim and Jung 2007) TaxID=408074 RepID=UPI002782B289|nr:N-acetylmuramoyl-L-alanine amidase [Chitinophaga terrae (ex Kim and Jung 2007)]MDQ0105828.1 N-acetylmuramoyl-L-alanine amidase [Chitinophaga terrae (ex Kim and Jung 2007)]